MDTDDATSLASRVLRRRPVEVLPPFVAEGAVGVVAQTVLLGTGAAALLAVRDSDRITRVTDAIAAATEDGTPTPADVEAIEAAIGGLLTPAVTAVLLAGAFATVVSVLVFRAAVGAAKVHAARAAIGDARGESDGAAATTRTDGGERRATTAPETDDGPADEEGDGPLVAAVRGVFADTTTFLGLTVLRVGLLVGAVALVGLLGPAGVLLALPVALFAYLAFLFAPEAIVVDGAGAVDGLRRSVGFLRRETGRAGLYVVLEIGVFVGAAIVSGALGLLGVGRASSVLSLFFVLPWLGLVRMGLYLPARSDLAGAGTTPAVETVPERSPETDPAGEPTGATPRTGEPEPGRDREDERPAATRGPSDESFADEFDDGFDGPGAGGGLGARLLDGGRAGLAELWRFVTGQFVLVVVAFGTFALGTAIGRFLGPRATEPITGDPGMVFGSFPLGTAINITINNWLVAIAGSYGGLALGLPSLGNLLFNGLIVGGLSGLFDPVVFAALVVPHALIEVPTLAVGGALGLHLGREGYGVARGTATAEAFAEELRRGFMVLVGLLPVFTVAGFVEAFLTPLVGSLVLG